MALQPFVRDFERGADRTHGYRDGVVRGIQWIEREEGEGAGAGRMEEDTELEEGETLEGGPSVDDLDSRFDYLDTKIEAVLGHCQKDFQGSLYADKLGSKFGGYGSFLPTHVRGAPVLNGPPQAPASVAPRSRPSEGQMERGRRVPGGGSVGASDRVSKVSPNDAGIKSHMQINGGSHSVDGSGNITMKGTKTEDGGFVDQKKGPSITVRMNYPGQGVDKIGKKAMYNGFGLDHSSSPSIDEDPDDAVSASEDEVSPDRSPLDMIRIMTSHHPPHGGLLSPLPDLLSEPLNRKEKPVSNVKSNKKLATSSSVIKPELGLGSIGTKLWIHDSEMGKDGKEKKDKASEMVKGKPLDRKEAIQLLESVKAGKGMEDDRWTGKEGGINAPKVPFKIPVKDGREVDLKGEKTDRFVAVDVRDVPGKEGENMKDPARSLRKEKVFSLELLKEDGTDLPYTENREVRRVKEDSVKDSKKSREPSLEPNLKDLVSKEPLKERRKSGGNRDTLKVQRAEEALQKDVLKQQYKREVGKPLEAVVAEKEAANEGPWEVKRVKESSKASQSQKEVKEKKNIALKEAGRMTKDSSKKEVVLRDDDNGKEPTKDSLKHSVRDIPKEVLKDLGKGDGRDPGLKAGRAGKKSGKKVGKEAKSINKGKEREIGITRDVLDPMGDDTGTQPPVPQPLPLPLTAGPSAETPAGAILLDHWVQCDKCQQWRLLIPGIDPAELPEKWLCKMMTWLPGLNSCKYSEDVTTAAVYKNLGLQNPALSLVNPGLQGQQPLPVPAVALPSELVPDNRILEAKPAKVQRSGSKKGMGKKPGSGTVKLSTSNAKRTDMGSLKSKSLNDVVQHPADRVADRSGLETVPEDVGYPRVLAEKRKLMEKDKLKRMRASEGDDMHPQKQTVREEERNRASGSWQDHEVGHLGKALLKVPVALEADVGGKENVWIESSDPESSKKQKGKLLQDGSKADNAGMKRKKKIESSEENDDLRSAKRGKVEKARIWKGVEATPRRKTHDDGDTHSLQYVSDDGAVQEGESGDRAGIRNKNVGRGITSGQPLKKVKVTPVPRDVKIDSRRLDLADAQQDERKMMDHQKLSNVKCKRDSFENLESSDGDKDKCHNEDTGRRMRDKEVIWKAEPKERDGQPDAKKRMKGGEIESGHHIEKPRIVSKHDVKDWGVSKEVMREGRRGQLKRSGISSETEFHLQNHTDEQSRAAVTLKVVKNEDVGGKNPMTFDEVSGIARTYAQHSGADGSPNGESPLPDVEVYTEEASQQTQKRPRSRASSASKVSYSAESSGFGSKGGSPIESTVSSTPVRSCKVDAEATGRRGMDGVQTNHIDYSHPSNKLNSVSPSPKRSVDRDVDTHRNWDDRPHSSDPEREFRGSGRDPTTDTSSGRARDDCYATSNSRDGGDFHKYDGGRSGRDDEHYWEDARDKRAGSASYFADRYDRHRDDRHQEKEDSVDRFRDRDNRYEKRGREDHFREQDRERDHERDRSRENWATDRGGEERYSRERSVRQDRGGRPSSRESRLDKQGSLNWRDEPRLGRDVGYEGRDRVEDENTENRYETRSNHVEGSKDHHFDEDELEAAQDAQKDDSGHRYEKIDLGPPKDAKSNFLRAPPPGQALHGWEGDRIGVASSGRRDPDANASRNGLDAHTVITHVNNRSRVDGSQSGLGSMSVRGKSGQVEGPALDVRIVDGGKQSKEHRKGVDEDALVRVSVAKTLGSSGHATKCVEGASSSPSKKEHAALAQGLTKEAKDLKHSADRLKSAASMEDESTNLYLQAALKFLQAAHHLEMASIESVRQGDTTQSMQMYNDTAGLCDFCASMYERQRDLAAAALAHICAAVARFRVMMGKSASLNKDCVELQNAAAAASSAAAAPGSQVAAAVTSLTSLPPQPLFSRASEKPGSSHGVRAPSIVGESSSSSSASDVDNLNNCHAIASDKVVAISLKGSAPSPIPGSTSGSTDVVPQRLYSNFYRMIRNGMDVFVMMESWTKAQNATAAAETACAGASPQLEGMLAVRRVGEIGLLGNMDAVVRQVRLALEAIGH